VSRDAVGRDSHVATASSHHPTAYDGRGQAAMGWEVRECRGGWRYSSQVRDTMRRMSATRGGQVAGGRTAELVDGD
jgi:hypothetical protein